MYCHGGSLASNSESGYSAERQDAARRVSLNAFIPVAPFLVGTGMAPIWIAFILAMLAHFGVGAARSIFTGRGVIRSGMDMFIVGLGVAVVGYFVGEWIVGVL